VQRERERERDREREVVSNKKDTIIKYKKRKNMLNVRCGNNSGQNCDGKGSGKGSGKETQVQEFTYRVTTNLGHEMYNYTSNTWHYQNNNKGLKKNLEALIGKYSICSL
jgi:hypothetical protein